MKAEELKNGDSIIIRKGDNDCCVAIVQYVVSFAPKPNTYAVTIGYDGKKHIIEGNSSSPDEIGWSLSSTK